MSKLKKLGTSFVMVLALIMTVACTLVFTACGGPKLNKGEVYAYKSADFFYDGEYEMSYEARKQNEDETRAMFAGADMKLTIVADNKAEMSMTMNGETSVTTYYFTIDADYQIALSEKEDMSEPADGIVKAWKGGDEICVDMEWSKNNNYTITVRITYKLK